MDGEWDEIEYLFNKDSRDKKRIGSSISKRASRKGYCRGGVKFPSDFLTKKQKKEMNGEIQMSHIYDDITKIPKLDVIQKMNKDEAKRILSLIRDKHSNKALAEHFGCTGSTVAYNYEKFGVIAKAKHIKINKEIIFSDINLIPKIEKILEMNDLDKRAYLYSAKMQFGTLTMQKYYNKGSGTMHGIYTRNNIYRNTQDECDKLVHRAKELAGTNIENNVAAKSTSTKIVQAVDQNGTSIVEEKNQEILEMKKTIENLEQALENSNSNMDKLIDSLNNLENKIVQAKKSKGFEFKFSGDYTKDSLENRLLSVSSILVEDKHYSIEFTLNEK